MIVGIPKEIKNNENRVAITPAGVHALVSSEHKVLVERSAGKAAEYWIRSLQQPELQLWLRA